MKHKTCALCGASLDFGESCDCGMPAGEPLTALEKPKVVIDSLNIDVNSAEIIKGSPMPQFIEDLISRITCNTLKPGGTK